LVPPLPEARSATETAILLSVFNGERFLPAQLESLLAQTHRSWRLYWRDDGSADASAELLRAFAKGPAAGRVVEVRSPAGRLGVTLSFLTLLAAAPLGDIIAYADQDDVWLPEKLARGVAALTGAPADTPTLYCARQTLVDANLAQIGLSFRLDRPPGFPAALTQNIATGCTAMLNRSAAALIARSHPPPTTLHDCWSYLVVAAAGGRIIADSEPSVLYRQHGGNVVGARDTLLKRACCALWRGPRPFMRVLRQHVAALAAEPDLLSPEAAGALAVIAEALSMPAWRRLQALRLAGFCRQTPLETALFRLWFLLG
jgi:Glycosyl transferase family 2